MRESNFQRGEEKRITRENHAYTTHRDSNQGYGPGGYVRRHVEPGQYPRKEHRTIQYRALRDGERSRGNVDRIDILIKRDPEGFKKRLDEELARYMAGAD
jgi:hypothetical protein